MRFRVEKQDGFAKLGEIDGFKTPMIIDLRDYELVNHFSNLADRKPPEVVKEIMRKAYEQLQRKGDIEKLVLTGLFPSAFANAILERDGFRPLYIPSVALPWNVALLVYMGADILDNALALKKAYEGVYLTETGEFRLDSLKDFPCLCEACRNREGFEDDFQFLAEHNTRVLERELKLAEQAIIIENLRELVEMRVKANPETTAILRIYDRISNAPHSRFKKSMLYPTSEDSFSRPEVRYYFERLNEVYQPSSHIALILPCSARKPYSMSKSHRRILNHLGKALKGVNEIIISSPFIAPRELELLYPIAFYDTPTTGVWAEWEVEFVAEKLAGLIERFETVVAYLHGGYRRVAEKAEKISGIEIEYFESLDELKKRLDSEEKEGFDRYKELFRQMLRYQFGVDYEIDGVSGRYPNLEFFTGRERVARVDMKYGNLDIYGKLAEFLLEKGVYSVEIGDFEVKGTIFSQGVVMADENIRPNDVVVYHNSETAGVGHAVMAGKFMGKVDGKAVISRRRLK